MEVSTPPTILDRFHIEERRHALAILKTDCPDELKDILQCLDQFRLLRSEMEEGGGGKSRIARRFDDFLAQSGWTEKKIRVKRTIDERTVETETHRVDFCKGQVAIEVEWNNKDPFFSRDLNVFRLLHELDAISMGVIITRMDELQEIFDGLGREIGKKYGASTTHWGKLMPRVEAAGAGTCPLLLIGIKAACYMDDVAPTRRAQPL